MERSTRWSRRPRAAGAALMCLAVVAGATACSAVGSTVVARSTQRTATTAPSGSGSTGGSNPAAAVPAEYQSTARTLTADIANLRSQDGAGSVVGTPQSTTMAGVLEVADGNRGQALLRPQTLSVANTMLDRFQAMGMTGVMIEVGYPMMLPDFPDSAAYLSFYEQVADAVHARDMSLSIELNPIFTNPQISTLHPDYSGLTVASYAEQQAQEAQIIIDDLHPTYLTLLDEPSTFAYNLSLPIATPAACVGLLDAELAHIDRGTTKLGAGIGTWENPTIDQAIATETDVDYLSVHVYPTGPQQIATLNEVTDVAAMAHKPVVMDETWLSKSNPVGAPGVGNPVIEGKIKNWSFWEPLDEQYLSAITTYARDHGFAFLAPFSTDLFFAYLTWTPTLETLSKGQVQARLSQIQLPAMDAGRLSPVGSSYQADIAAH